ncbi:MAG: hypothetical protein WDW38_000804 [Sanguina aurantia]
MAPPAKGAPGPMTGLKFLPEEARVRAQDRKANKQEKIKVEKGGHTAWTDVFELSTLLREGNTKWEDLNLDDVDVRLKWAGLFHRSKRTPTKFMMRIKLPNGVMNGEQLRYAAEAIAPYGADGCADITTRAGIQLRGISLEDAGPICEQLIAKNMSSFQTGMDSIRNLTGSPIAGVDPHELIDTVPILFAMNDMLHNKGLGREDMANLPRKLNICISASRDDFPHTHINDVGFEAVKDHATGEVKFNVMVGGYFSIKRNVMSIPLNCSVSQEQLLPFTEALLFVFRDYGPRGDRQQTRLMWLIEALGVERTKELIGQYMGGITLNAAIEEHHATPWPRRDILGVHAQKQAGHSWVGACVPAGRMHAADFVDVADVAEKYGDGTVRLTCDQDIIFTNVLNENIEAMLAEPLFQRFQVNPGNLVRGMVSCTGNQFCGFGMAETKGKSVKVLEQLEAELDIPSLVRIHFTGCPNSCGQAQVGDIGLMGAPAKMNGKATEGFKIMVGGSIGENPTLATDFAVGIPASDEYLVPELRKILIEKFGASVKQVKAAAAEKFVEWTPVWAPVQELAPIMYKF